MMERHITKEVQIGNRWIGGNHPIAIQSMTNTKTEDVAATVAQIKQLTKVGCEIIRCAVPTQEAAAALTEIKKQITIPLVADIHFDYRLAIAAMEHGADKKRAMTYGLITEELAIFLANIGFKDGEEHNINARLVAKDDDLIIRMRDDCKPLNLKDYYQALLETPEIEDEEISLAIIFKMAKDVKYTATFGANNLIIRV